MESKRKAMVYVNVNTSGRAEEEQPEKDQKRMKGCVRNGTWAQNVVTKMRQEETCLFTRLVII